MTNPRGHLGPEVSALVDGELNHDDRDRALAHLTRCPACRAVVDSERAAKAVIANLSDPVPSEVLVASLLSLPGPLDPLPPDRPSFPGGARPVPASWRPISQPPAGSAPGSRRPAIGRLTKPASGPTRRAQLFAVGAFSAVAITLGLAALGAERPATPPPASIVPPVSDFTVEHARSTSQFPFSGPSVVFEPVGSDASGRLLDSETGRR